jgi:ABC-2 type transport system ATP-binding protein
MSEDAVSNGSGPPAVECRGLVKRFGDSTALAGIDLEVQPGEIYGFLGPNGAGKSTLVRTLCTLQLPTEGTAMVLGHDVVHDTDAVRLAIGVALQEAALDLKQSGRELLVLQGRLYGLTKAEAQQRVTDLEPLVDIGAALERPIGTYSGGMQRRLDLAAALIHNPQMLFLDEPTTGLDPTSRTRVWEEVRRLNDELGMTIFLTTQYLEEADELADRVGIIDRGSLVAEGTPAELKRAIGTDVIVARVEGDAESARTAVAAVEGVDQVEVHGSELTATAEQGSAVVSPVAVALDGCDVRVLELTLRTPTLDDVFLELTGGRLGEGEEPTDEEEEAA